jgi:hypothetical protein
MRYWCSKAPRIFTSAVLLCAAARAASGLERLRVSENGRFLVTARGKPFFWLGDTAWKLIQGTVREDTPNQPSVRRYFENRAAKGFTVVQACAVSWVSVNAYGQEAFIDGDYSRPRTVPGPANDYWDFVDDVLDIAAQHNIYVALLPMWLKIVPDDNPIVRDPSKAYRYGHFLGSRYHARANIIWVLGGDPSPATDVDHPARLALTRAVAEGIADGVNGVDLFDGQADFSTTMMTFHPTGGGQSSSRLLHNEPWLDFNMIQTGARFQFTNYETVAADYAKSPVKPTLDGEVAYEGSLSLRRSEPQDRRVGPWEVRKGAYWDLFAGGFGHTYGHRSFIGWLRRGETDVWGAIIPWFESLDAPGALQMSHLRALMESRPFLSRIPDQSVIAGNERPGMERALATRGTDGAYAMVYLPTGRPVSVNLEKLSGNTVSAWWFDPRRGTARRIGSFERNGEREFVPPSEGEDHDWVLVLDDASRKFDAPGAGRQPWRKR